MDSFEFIPWEQYQDTQVEEGFIDSSDYTSPNGEAEVRGQLQSLHSQTKSFINNTIVEGINDIDERLTVVEPAVTNVVSTDSDVIEVSISNNTLTIRPISGTGGETTRTYVDDQDETYYGYAKTYSDTNLATAEAYVDDKLEIITGTLSAGNTSITITDDGITTSSIFSFYTSEYGVNPTAVSVSTGSIVLTFDEQETDITVGVRIDGTV